MDNIIKMCRTRAKLKVITDRQNPLYMEVIKPKGNRIKSGQSWVSQAEEIFKQLYRVEELETGEKWFLQSKYCSNLFNEYIALNKECRFQN
jgi:hypothetical protein